MLQSKIRFRKEFWTKVFFSGHPPPDDTDYKPSLTLPSLWEPPVKGIPPEIRQRTSNFFKEINRSFRKQRNRDNLTTSQLQALRELRDDKTILIAACDKNLGPALITRDRYIELAFHDHLSDTTTYKRLPRTIATLRLGQVALAIDDWLKEFKPAITKQAYKFVKNKTASQRDNFSAFYLMPKIHKQPLKTRPVTSVSGSIIEPIGLWIDSILQQIAKAQPTYLTSSRQLKDEISIIDLPDNATLFTADAVSMYTNIRTDAALSEIRSYLETHTLEFPTVPINALMSALNIAMNNNLFRFGDTFWLQKTGAAMGQPQVPPYANLFFAIHEANILQNFDANLRYYKRYIDDVFGIWIPTTDNQRTLFEAAMNTYHSMQWEFSDYTNSVNFMDLTIQKRNDEPRVHITIYEKPQNLHLYLPSASSHPPGVIKGLIFGQIFYIRNLCTEKKDADAKIQQLFYRLRARGWPTETLQPIFQEGFNRYDPNRRPVANIEPDSTAETTVRFHLEYRPDDPPRSRLQEMWRRTIYAPPGECIINSIAAIKRRPRDPTRLITVNRLSVAYSRVKNLGNMLSSRTLTDDPPVSTSTSARVHEQRTTPVTLQSWLQRLPPPHNANLNPSTADEAHRETLN